MAFLDIHSVKFNSNSNELQFGGSSLSNAQDGKMSAAAQGALVKALQSKFSFPAITAQSLLTSQFGVVSNGLAIFLEASKIRHAAKAFKQSSKIGDKEGKILAESNIASGVLGIGASATLLAGLASSLADENPLVVSTTGLVGNILLGAGSLLGMGISAYRLVQFGLFRKELNQMEKELLSANSKEAVSKTLRGLQKMILGSEEEIEQLRRSIEQEHPLLTVAEKGALFQQKSLENIKKKIHCFKRRSGLKSIQLIVDLSNELLPKLNTPQDVDGALKKTRQLVQFIRSENTKKTAFFVAVFVASLLGFIAFIGATFFSFGLAPFILLAVTSLISLGAVIVNGIVAQIQKKYLLNPIS